MDALGIKKNISELSENEINTSDQLTVVWNATKNCTNTKASRKSYDKSNDVEEIDVKNNGTTKTQKQEDDDDEFDDSGDGGGQNFVTMLISTFLGSLSTPEGGVDVDALVALIGTLSVMRDDGTYDFTGLQTTLMNFLGK
ncbi:uncharacterized protein LOC108744756 [Agrilus planipennis]|uniref:Uncharacterized protein LOC108744756 n=1 Tax=Agrilus planipennis TaxID=224129 RepID=A0A1W4XTP6_AGRPL|nr:uncharacterized protein LOC108744756 [Agrilus planipennis]